MKKSILLLAVFNKSNPLKSKYSQEVVYRHLSTLSLSKINKLTKELNIDVYHLCIHVFFILTYAYYKKRNITIFTKCNDKNILKLNYSINKNMLFKEINLNSKILTQNKYSDIFEKLSFKFELKIIKRKILLSYFSTDDFVLDETSQNIIFHYEKLVRQLIKNPYVSIEELSRNVSSYS